MRKQRKNYTPEEKVSILRKHLVEGTAVSELCDQYQLQPTVFYRWQKQFFEKGALAFEGGKGRETAALKRIITKLEGEIATKNEVLSEHPQALIADVAYGSEESYDYLKDKNITAYVKYNSIHYEQKKRYQKKKAYHQESFRYLAKKNQYLCP